MPGAAPLRYPVKPPPAMVDRGFSGARRKTPAGGPDEPNDRLIRSPIHRETIVRQPAGAPCPGARCLVTPL
ncbi:hypothetical protein DF153_20555 [Burkholderia cenocepacia]|nr:hypothetical protein DF152_13465 [Burkholderia cenocepacia]RQU20909.1 hypothetical protein DF153_20555 [Burkholderia cenocepacia]